MAAGILYDLEFHNTEEVFVKVTIADNSVQTDGTPQVIKLTGADVPVRISTIDEGESKFTPVKSQQVIISFLSDSLVNLSTFADGPDDRFSVTVLYGSTIIFYGFLSLDDNSELFVAGRNEVVLVANDKLAALKNIPLTDFAGDNPQGKYTIAELVAMCLQKTGLDLELRVINNLRPGSGRITVLATFDSSPNQIIVAITSFFYIGQKVAVTGTALNNIVFTVTDVGQNIVTIVASDDAFVDEVEVMATFTDNAFSTHFYNDVYLDAKTFEEEIGVSENCYSVLEKILGYDCFLTQYKERWWICRVDEYDNNELLVAKYSSVGVFDTTYTETSLSKNIGFNETHYFSEEATRISPTRPNWFAKLLFSYDYPIETLCNIDFSRAITGDTPDPTNGDEDLLLDPECWTFYANHFDGSEWTDGTPQAGSVGKLFKHYEFAYEKERYLIVEHEDVVGDDEVHYFKSTGVEILVGEKFNLTTDFRLDSAYGFTSLNPIQVTLVPFDGSEPWFWDHDAGSDVNQWVERATPTTNPFSVTVRWQGSTPNDEWTNVGGECPPLPKSGTVYIKLAANFNVFAPFHFSNLVFDYIPLINGSYKVYNGSFHKVTRSETGYLATIDDEVFISDSFGRLIKGAMFWLDGTFYKLTTKWFDASKSGFTFPDLADVRPFGELQAYAVWNQVRLANSVFEYSIQGLGEDIPSLVHKYSITDMSVMSSNRRYLMLTKDVDLKHCSARGVIEQVYNTTEGKIYTDDHEFKYIS